jgi:hypothetical protein
MKELSQEMKELLKNINICCIKISEKENLNCKFNKLEFLEKENFYDDYPNTDFY